MTLTTVSEICAHGGVQGVYRHEGRETKTPMTFSVFVPEHGPGSKLSVVWHLSGLTDPAGAYDFGLGAGFYVDAVEPPYAEHYRMWSYVSAELPGVVGEAFHADMSRQSTMGPSMGGHGALTLGLTFPERYKAVSAFSPIVAPMQVSWGNKALGGHMAQDRAAWRRQDAMALIEAGARVPDLLIDQGEADPFVAEQLRPDLLEAACRAAGQPLTLRRRPGYDHSYYFISTFMADQLRWHASRLGPSA